MARYTTTVETPLSPEEAFAFMADLTNFASWDPGVSRSVRVRGDGPGVGSTYDLTLTSVTRPTLRYEVVRYDAPRSLRVVARTLTLTSIDDIRVEALEGGEGSRVTYDAELTLSGPLRLFDRGLQVVFDRLGDRAAAGLRKALRADGSRP
jgi:carbon monoxide dehydrogenase subunit G